MAAQRDGRARVPGLVRGLAVSVHGPAGALDLLVPRDALTTDVAREYAAQTGLASIPVLLTPLGRPLDPQACLADTGLEEGAVLVATTTVQPAVRRAARRSGRQDPADCVRAPGGRRGQTRSAQARSLVAALAAGLALLGGVVAAVGDHHHAAVVPLLLVGAVVGMVPFGVGQPARGLAAPVFAASAIAVLVGGGGSAPGLLPLVLGIGGVAGAVAAVAVRSLHAPRSGLEILDAAARVWTVAGCGLFTLAVSAMLLDAPPRVVWALAMVAALLAARVVPTLAVDVPDSYLVDLERLAVTAWSARDRPRGRRGRVIVPEAAVVAVVRRGSALLTASAAAVLAVSLAAAPLLLATASLPLDRIGARVLVGCCAAGLLLAARSYRHAIARGLLRLAGTGCGVALVWTLVPALGSAGWWWTAVAAPAVGLVLVSAAVASGRGWRSAWWARRAEVAEAVCGSVAIASAVVAAGFFRRLWEMTS